MNLRERARAAAAEHTDTDPFLDRAHRCTVGLETILAGSRRAITARRDGQRCEPGTASPEIVLTYTEGDEQFEFIPYHGDEDFLVLGPCPVCSGQVPRASIANLADLGGYLQYPDLAEPPEPFYGDPGHHTECTFNHG